MSYPANPPPYSGPEQGVPMVHIHQPGPQVITTAVPVVVSQPVGSDPALIVCQSCRHQIMTKIETRPTARTHIWAICLFVIGCWPCMWIPYCTNSCMNVDHYCPNCNAYVGRYRF